MEAKPEVPGSPWTETKNRFKQSMEWQGRYPLRRDKDKGFRSTQYGLGRVVESHCPGQRRRSQQNQLGRTEPRRSSASAHKVKETIPTK